MPCNNMNQYRIVSHGLSYLKGISIETYLPASIGFRNNIKHQQVKAIYNHKRIDREQHSLNKNLEK